MKRSFESSTNESDKKRRKVSFESNVRHASLGRQKFKSARSEGDVRMAQRISQMNPLEQSRYEAFKQSTFSSTAISNYIAACLIYSNKRSSRNRLNHITLLGGSVAAVHNSSSIGESESGDDDNEDKEKSDQKSLEQPKSQIIIPPSELAAVEGNSILSTIHSRSNFRSHRPELSDLVAPGTASKITAVVTTLAKIHAQRLVQRARIIATKDYNFDSNKPILPQHLLEAHRRSRNQNGKNGFFMNLSSSSTLTQNNASFLNEYCSLGNGTGVNSYCESGENIATASEQNQIKYMAALQAQEDFDKLFVTEEEGGKEEVEHNETTAIPDEEGTLN